MRILVGCEESQIVTKELRKLGHEAYSCDIQECSGGYPEWHYREDLLQIINWGNWDMLIAFPPCTNLARSGARYWETKKASGELWESMKFVKQLWASRIPKIAIENPIGILNTHWQPATQIIHPYQFGEPYTKETCLWLKNLPKLKQTNKVYGKESWVIAKRNPKTRSKTFEGIAKAMATQWTAKYDEQLTLFNNEIMERHN